MELCCRGSRYLTRLSIRHKGPEKPELSEVTRSFEWHNQSTIHRYSSLPFSPIYPLLHSSFPITIVLLLSKGLLYREGKVVKFMASATMELVHVLMPLISFMILLWTVLAIELTLYWNSITDIYSVNSTGLFIAFIVRLGTLLSLLWKLSQKSVCSTLTQSHTYNQN